MLALLAVASAVAFMGPNGVTAPAPRCVTAQAPRTMRPVAGVQLTNAMAMPHARLANPRARVVAQAPGWRSNPAVVGVQRLYDRVVDDSLAERNVEETRANYEVELQKDPDSTDTAYAAFALRAALNAYYEDELRLPPAIGAVGSIVAGALLAWIWAHHGHIIPR